MSLAATDEGVLWSYYVEKVEYLQSINLSKLVTPHVGTVDRTWGAFVGNQSFNHSRTA